MCCDEPHSCDVHNTQDIFQKSLSTQRKAEPRFTTVSFGTSYASHPGFTRGLLLAFISCDLIRPTLRFSGAIFSVMFVVETFVNTDEPLPRKLYDTPFFCEMFNAYGCTKPLTCSLKYHGKLFMELEPQVSISWSEIGRYFYPGTPGTTPTQELTSPSRTVENWLSTTAND